MVDLDAAERFEAGHARLLDRRRFDVLFRGAPAEQRRRMRQARSKPILDALKPWLERQLVLVSGKSTLAGAIRYALSRWQGLSRFLDDGRVELDSNVVERAEYLVARAAPV